jgi:MFS family permease
MELVVLSWYVLEKSNSPIIVGIYGALRFSGTLFAPLIGGLADRTNRRRLLLIIRASYLINGSVILFLIFLNLLDPWVVLLMTFLFGLSKTADFVIKQAIIPNIAGRENINNSVALFRAGNDITQMIGPAIGGLILSTFDIQISYVVIIVFYLASLLTLMKINKSAITSVSTSRPILADLKQSTVYAIKTPIILGLLALAVIINLTAFPTYFGLISVLAKSTFQTSAANLGFMLGTYSLGAVIGSVFIGSFKKESSLGKILVIGTAIWHIGIIGLSQVTSLNITWPILFITGLGQSLCVVTMASMLITFTPGDMLGRIIGLRQLAVYALPMGLPIAGVMAELMSVQVALAVDGIFGTILLIGAILIWPSIYRNSPVSNSIKSDQ